MKRTILIVVCLLSLALPALLMAKEKAAPVDLKGMNNVFLGWVNMSPEDYHHQGYSTKEEYQAVINHANTAFQESCQKAFSGRTVTAAKNPGDENTAGNDVYVKFSDVVYDHKYRLTISVHFIDLKTNAEIGSIPKKTYSAHYCGLEGCMIKELDKVSEELQKEFAGGK
ncbi:MAG: hypothetical protein ACLPHP_19790 [Candidatus Sulfotelmatobacter sp.]